jgi:hypothetical protein
MKANAAFLVAIGTACVWAALGYKGLSTGWVIIAALS